MTKNISIIALDGPAASGKSTLGRTLADSLGYLFFDTGIMYRAITWIALQHDMDLLNEAAITELAQKAQIDIRPPSKDDGRACDVVIGEKDVTWDMRGDQWFLRMRVCVRLYPSISGGSGCAAGW